MVARSTTVVKALAETPVQVALLAPAPPVPQRLTLPRRSVAVARAIPAPMPEYQWLTDRSEIESTTAAVAVAVQRPAEPSSSPSPDPTPDLQVMSSVAYVQRPLPAYPRESCLAREEGLVILRVLIDEFGHARDIDIYRSSGHPRLDREACAAVARALFKPYLAGGTARAAIAVVPIEFSLR